MKNKLKQLFRDNRKVSNAVRIEAKEKEATIYLYDAIGGWFGIDVEDLVRQIADIKAEVIHLRVNSPGGDVFDARALQTVIMQHPAKVIAHIDGLAASSASFVVIGADEIEMAEGAFFMIHKAWALEIGNAEEMRQTAELLDKVDETIIADFQRKTGQEADTIRAWMEGETWFTAAEALEKGFIDRIFEGEKVDNLFNLSAYRNVPEALTENTNKRSEAVAEEPRYDREQLLRRIRLFEDFGR